ncbi:MAG TPA: methyltransferase domain-containing protein, partial [Steroidobacteraceae bacterium]|nr:methyltransferase domain-containing protein [Steroidobacteraceae bacterium]
RYDEAASVYRDWLTYHPGDPIARHMLAAVTGENAPVRADDAYVTATFDKFAESFDENLQELGYRAPQLLAERLGALAEKAATLDVLDAGCGTGLCGPLLRPFARTLAGVDLSPGMVQRARAREVYDELAVQELCAFMRSRPASFDLVISADTLCYFGALEEPLAAARECLRRDGWLAFTLERLEPAAAGDYRIEPHGRYSHDEAYVCRALAAAGFVKCEATHASLRRERGADVQGILASASAT